MRVILATLWNTAVRKWATAWHFFTVNFFKQESCLSIILRLWWGEFCNCHWHCPHSMPSRVYVAVGRLSVCLSVYLSVPSISSSSSVQWVCCWALCRQEISIDSRCRHSAATAWQHSAEQQMQAVSWWQLRHKNEHRLVLVRNLLLSFPWKKHFENLSPFTEIIGKSVMATVVTCEQMKRPGPILRNFSGCTISKVHVWCNALTLSKVTTS